MRPKAPLPRRKSGEAITAQFETIDTSRAAESAGASPLRDAQSSLMPVSNERMPASASSAASSPARDCGSWPNTSQSTLQQGGSICARLEATEPPVIDWQRIITGHIVTTATVALTGWLGGEALVQALSAAGESAEVAKAATRKRKSGKALTAAFEALDASQAPVVRSSGRHPVVGSNTLERRSQALGLQPQGLSLFHRRCVTLSWPPQAPAGSGGCT